MATKNTKIEETLENKLFESTTIYGIPMWGVDKNDSTIYRTQSGAVLKLKPVSSQLILRRSRSIDPPVVPTFLDEETGREHENPGDSKYLTAFTKYQSDLSYVNMGTYFLFGIDILEMPEDVMRVEDTSWSDRLENKATWGEQAMEIPPCDAEHMDARFIFWVTNILLRDIEAIQVGAQIRYLGGMVEEVAVQEAMSTFPGVSSGGTDRTMEPNRKQRRDSDRGSRRVRSK